MNPLQRIVLSLISLAILIGVIGYAAEGSFNPVTFFAEAETVMVVVLSVLAALMFLNLLLLLALFSLRAQGLTTDTVCAYSRCPAQNTPLWSMISLGGRAVVVKCYGNEHPPGNEWFHKACWTEENHRPASLGRNICNQCKQLAAMSWR